jgi:hypothetical protein
MKLILLYGGGDGGESYFDATQPIEYESKEALKRDLTAAVENTLARWRARKTWTLQEWLEARDKAMKKTRTMEEAMTLLQSQGFVHDDGSFDFHGLHLNAACFCYGGYDHFGSYHDFKDEFNPTTIEENVLTLDEWFEREAVKQKPA